MSIKILETELFSGSFIPVSLRSSLSLHLRNEAAAEPTIETARDSRRRNETVFCEDVAADDDGDDKSRRTTVNYSKGLPLLTVYLDIWQTTQNHKYSRI